MKILYQIPSIESVYAARFIFEGYNDAFIDLGHEFKPLTSNDNLGEVLEEYRPDIFISSLNSYNLRFLDLELLLKYRNNGLIFFNQIRPWKKQNNQISGSDLGSEKELIDLIKRGLAGDIFFHWLEQDDPSMEGFSKTTGYPFHTILLAANKKKYYYEYDEKYLADISYVGSLLTDKKVFMAKHFFPVMKKYNTKVYGSDWTTRDKLLGYVQKIGQYFNIDTLKKVRDIKLSMDDERKVYSSSTISLNIHEDHQRKFGGDFNERTLKIIASGGFEICDNVKVLRKYFTSDELVIGENTQDWFEKIDYYLKNPDKRISIIANGKKKVLALHTYQNRVEQIIQICNHYKSNQ